MAASIIYSVPEESDDTNWMFSDVFDTIPKRKAVLNKDFLSFPNKVRDQDTMEEDEMEDDSDDLDDVSTSAHSLLSSENAGEIRLGEFVSLESKKKAERKKRKMKARKNHLHPDTRDLVTIPKVVRNDVRRYFAPMLINVMNSHSSSTTKDFLKTFGAPNLSMKRRIFPIRFHAPTDYFHLFGSEGNRGQSSDVMGVPCIVQFLNLQSLLHPDQITRLDNAVLITRSDTLWSKVVLDLRINYTQLYDFHPFHYIDAMFENLYNRKVPVDKLSGKGDCSNICSGGDNVFPCNEMFESYAGYKLPLLPQPQNMEIRAQLALHINERKELSVMEVVFAIVFKI